MKRYIYTTVLLFLIPFLAGAQALKGSYFLDNSMNRHRMNPAFTPRANYFQLPAIGNIGVGAVTNLDIPTFFFPQNGQLLTFLNKNVTVDQFAQALPQFPHLDADVNTNLLSFGFFTKQKSYWTFDLDVRVMADVDLPRDLFMFLKKGTGTSGQSYNIGNINAYMSGAVQASLGYSRDIIKGLRAGVKARFIAPVAYAGLNLEQVKLTTGKEKWNISTEGHMNAAMRGLDLSIPAGETMPSFAFDPDKMIADKVLAGYGYSFDLGVEYKLEIGSIFDGISVSAAVTDLGQIFYSQDAVSSFTSTGSLDWVGFQDISMDNTDFQAAIDDLTSKAEDLLNLKEKKTEGSLVTSSMPRIYAGIDIPFLYRTMSVGLLYSARFSHSYARQELTASYNLKPCNWFAMGVNWSFLNTIQTLGFMLEFTPKVGPTLYIGADYIPVAFAKAPIVENWAEAPSFLQSLGLDTWALPLGLRLNLNFGMSFTLGSKYGR